jgi:opacity protein-like surface antigen
MKRLFIILALVLLWATPALSDDTVGANYHFSHADGTGTRSSSSFNPDAPGSGWSHTFDSGSTLNSDGSWSIPLSQDANAIVIRTEPTFDD